MKTVIEIDVDVWANVKHFATVKRITLNIAVETLLKSALSKSGYRAAQEREL